MRSVTRSASSTPASATTPALTGRSWPARSGTWPARRESASSWTSAPACQPPTTPTRSPSRSRPESRIVYVDNDPLVLAHARALLTSKPEGATAYIDADLRDPGAILAEAANTLDFTQPVALTLLGVVIFINDDEEAYGIVRGLVDAVPSGSYLVLSHTITSPATGEMDAAVAFWNEHGTPKLTQRTRSQITRFFDGLDLLEPGVVSCSRWRPEDTPRGEPDEVAMFGGVGRKR